MAGSHSSKEHMKRSMKRAGNPKFADHSKPSHPKYRVSRQRGGEPSFDNYANAMPMATPGMDRGGDPSIMNQPGMEQSGGQ